MLIVRKLKDKRTCFLVRDLYLKAFPEQERIPYGFLRILSFFPKHYFCALYDDETFIGMIYYVINKESLLCCYFAIDEAFRSEGYGCEAMKWLKTQASDIYVIMESLDVDCTNPGQRMRRQKFYMRNGFYDSGYWYVDYYNEYYDILSNTDIFDVSAYQKLGKTFTFWDRKLKIEKK